jgi:hypothetical protein
MLPHLGARRHLPKLPVRLIPQGFDISLLQSTATGVPVFLDTDPVRLEAEASQLGRSLRLRLSSAKPGKAASPITRSQSSVAARAVGLTTVIAPGSSGDA